MQYRRGLLSLLQRWLGNLTLLLLQVMALGFVSVYDQILDGLADEERSAVFKAYIEALGESPEQYRSDAAKLEKMASELSSGAGASGLTADASGSELQQVLAKVADASKDGKLAYNKFFAIGLFRLLELAGAPRRGAAVRRVGCVVGRASANCPDP